MSIEKLTSDKKAADIYCSLGTHIHPSTLADDYLQGKLKGNTSLCLALECFIRDLARMHFDKPGVLEALSKMERYKAMRKPGTGAPRMFQEIADIIEQDYIAGDYIRLADNKIQFWAGNLKVTCESLPGAVALVCAKYRRGLPGGFGNGKAKRDR